jgi:hypothetical protein
MLHSLLFPYRARYVGWLIFIPAAVLGVITLVDDDFGFSFLTFTLPKSIFLTQPFTGADDDSGWTQVNLTNELAALAVMVGLFLVAFSRERVEDELISRMRLEALQWSVIVYYIILSLIILSSHGLGFFYVLSHNMFTLLLVFIARFRWLMYRHNHQLLAL